MSRPAWRRFSYLIGQRDAKRSNDIEMQPIGPYTANVANGINANGIPAPIISNSTSWRDDVQLNSVSREKLIRAVACSPPVLVLSHFRSRTEGLAKAKAADRLLLVGPNELTADKPRSWWMILKSALSPFTALLGVLAMLAIATRTWPNFTVIGLMFSLSCCVRFWQECNGQATAIKLQSKISRLVQIRRPRDTRLRTTAFVEDFVDFKTLVPGDIIMLSPGDSVPADCLLLETNCLQLSQSSLTGESEPQNKTADPSTHMVDKAVFDLENIAFSGTSVVSGTAVALVIATGDGAYIATITEQLKKEQPKSAFETGLRHVSLLLIWSMSVMMAIILIVRGQLSGDWETSAIFSLSVAVGIVPEMLPAILNLNLRRGSSMLGKLGIVVRTSGAVQNLGSMGVLCSDKTGTLTKDKISLTSAMNFSGQESDKVLRMAYTNALHQSGRKNEIDAAILRKEDSRGPNMSLGACIREIPFRFEKRRSSVTVKPRRGEAQLICKGAFEEVINLCTDIALEGGTVELSDSHKQPLFARVHTLNDDGYRVLAVATKVMPSTETAERKTPDADPESNLVFQGLLTFLDPLRDDAATAIAALQDLGVEVKILTGDNARIAAKACRSLNINKSANVEGGLTAVTGPELERMTEDEFHAAVKKATVLAKLTPAQKGEVVLSLKKGGQSVGMLGDGINDSIALSVADVGISVSNAVTVAKDCADAILTEKSLDAILAGVRTGRTTHGNTMKYLETVTSSNVGNVLTVLIASAWLPYEPMTALQFLVQNLLLDIAQMAIPWDRMDDSYLARPRVWDMRDLFRFIACLAPISCAVDMATFCLNWFYYGVRTADDPSQVAMTHTHWFLQGLVTQAIIIHVTRTARVPFVQSRGSMVLGLTTAAVVVTGVVVPFIPPLASALEMGQPVGSFMGFLAAELVGYCVIVQLMKMAYVWCFNTWI